MKKIVVAITGASGTIYGLRLLEALKANPAVQTHLIMTKWAWENLAIEHTGYTKQGVLDLADEVYNERNMGAAVASGSFLHDGMVIVPASMKTIASIATGMGDTLVGRAADVTLKERRTTADCPARIPL
jgi:4-hydroxy-3-polyprenylbenzoate decarboxylase